MGLRSAVNVLGGAPPNAVASLQFRASVVNTYARSEIEFGCGAAEPDPGSEIAGVIKVMAHSGRIPATSRIKSILLGGGPHVRLTGDFESKPNRPPVGGNDSHSSVSHSRPIFTSSWHFDSEMAI